MNRELAAYSEQLLVGTETTPEELVAYAVGRGAVPDPALAMADAVRAGWATHTVTPDPTAPASGDTR